MKRLFCSVIMSLMALFAIWTIIAYVNYGNELYKYHLDLQSTLRRINLVFDSSRFGNFGLLSVFRSFKENLDTINNFSITKLVIETVSGNKLTTISSGFSLLLNAIESLFNPLATFFSTIYLLAYIPIIILELVLYAVNFILGIVEFILSPVFIKYIP